MDEPKPDIHTIRFIALVDSFYGAAMTFLGKVADPQTGKSIRELDKAQAYIDFLTTMQVKTAGNLSRPEEDHLERLLATLRLNYVDELKAARAAEAAGGGDGKDGGESGDVSDGAEGEGAESR